MDNMLSIMEKYASNLEDLVQERTTQLMEEKKKTDALLHRMLPTFVEAKTLFLIWIIILALICFLSSFF